MKLINCSIVKEDSDGLYFDELNEKNQLIKKVRPTEMGFSKEMETEIYVYKEVQSTESLQNELVYFSMTLKFAFPAEAKYKTMYFYKCKSGRVMLRDFDSTVCAEVGVNDSVFVTRSKAKKLPENSRIAKDAAIYKINPTTSELEREVSQVW